MLSWRLKLGKRTHNETRKKLKEVFDECIRNDCKICFDFVDRYETIFDSESLSRSQRVRNCGHEKICDCVILCRHGKILAVEYLGGKLTLGKIEEKIKQLKCCEQVIKTHLEQFIYKILIYQKLDIPPAKRELINNKQRKENIVFIQEKNIRKNLCAKVDAEVE